jgi:hypothetical protein
MSANPPNPKFEDVLTDQMRAALGVSHRPNRPGGAFGIHKKAYHQPWKSDRPIQGETAFANGPQPSLSHSNRRDEAEQAARAERVAREQLERQLREKEAARIALETRLGHEAMARREAEAARQEAESRLAAASITAPGWSISPPVSPEPPQPAQRVKRAYVRHKAIAERTPPYDHPKRPIGRMPGFLPGTGGMYDCRHLPSTETAWEFAVPAVAAVEPTPIPPPPKPPIPPLPDPAPLPAAKRTGQRPERQRPVAWWKPGWREKMYG